MPKEITGPVQTGDAEYNRRQALLAELNQLTTMNAPWMDPNEMYAYDSGLSTAVLEVAVETERRLAEGGSIGV